MVTKSTLEKIYQEVNKRKLVNPDPLQFLYDYADPLDREVVGLIASSLAYGRVAQILKSIDSILSKMGKSPHKFIIDGTEKQFANCFNGFKYRFTTDDDIVRLLCSTKNGYNQFGSLKKCFLAGLSPDDENIIPALIKFTDFMTSTFESNSSYLLPSPKKGSATKRLMLYLRWMVRKDEVDPGGWDDISSSLLIIPLDTHMYQIGQKMGFTKRKQANLKTALEITAAFKKFCPEDPVKYDFALTRYGIRDDMGELKI